MDDTLTAEWVVMDTWLDDEIACESEHRHPTNLVCSQSVTHLGQGCDDSFALRVCTAHVHSKAAWIAGGGLCGACKRPAADCWSYRPI